MNTKAKVISQAKKLGCTLKITEFDVALYAPKGRLLAGELHISVYDTELYKKSEIWSNFMSEMSYIEDCEGSKYCTCKAVA